MLVELSDASSLKKCHHFLKYIIFICIFRIDLVNSESVNEVNMISNRLGRSSRSSRDHHKKSKPNLAKKLKRRRLVFLDESPDYCSANITGGAEGKYIF